MRDKLDRQSRARLRRVAAALFLLFALPSSQAQNVEKQIMKVVLSGKRVLVVALVAANPDCSIIEIPEIVVRSKPKVGELEIEEGPEFTTFPKGDVRYECSTKPLQMNRLYYTSPPDFKGIVRFTAEGFWTATGQSQVFRVNIRVK